MGNFKVKEIQNYYRYMGKQEVDLQEYDFGIVCSDFCLLWKEGKKPSKKITLSLIKDMHKVEELKEQISEVKGK